MYHIYMYIYVCIPRNQCSPSILLVLLYLRQRASEAFGGQRLGQRDERGGGVGAISLVCCHQLLPSGSNYNCSPLRKCQITTLQVLDNASGG